MLHFDSNKQDLPLDLVTLKSGAPEIRVTLKPALKPALLARAEV